MTIRKLQRLRFYQTRPELAKPMISSSIARTFIGAALLAVSPVVLSAQAAYKVELSGRANTVAKASAQGLEALQVSIDYGQPHLRGRDAATLIPLGKVWRLGANSATTLTTNANFVVGNTTVPKGTYTLFLQREERGAKLIISKQTGQWGTQYNVEQDLARVDMRSTMLHQPLEALQIALVPSQDGAGGVLRVVWGTYLFETNWSIKP